MRLSEILNSALNTQALNEYRNMILYKKIQSLCEEFQLKNLAKYFEKQAQEEKEHGDKFIDYINSRTGGFVSINEFPTPAEVLATGVGLETFSEIYVTAEEQTTRNIEEIYALAMESASYMDLGFLQKMLNEQVEEEDSAQRLYQNLKMVKDLVLFDKSLEV